MTPSERREKREQCLEERLWQCGIYLTRCRDGRWSVFPYDSLDSSHTVVDDRGVINTYLAGAGTAGGCCWWACIQLGMKAWDGSEMRAAK